jgi:hypothetical protein
MTSKPISYVFNIHEHDDYEMKDYLILVDAIQTSGAISLTRPSVAWSPKEE